MYSGVFFIWLHYLFKKKLIMPMNFIKKYRANYVYHWLFLMNLLENKQKSDPSTQTIKRNSTAFDYLWNK